MIDGEYSPAKSTFSSFRKKSEATEADITEQVKEIISIAQLDRLIRIPSEITDSDIRELISEIHSLGIIDTSRSFLLHLLRLWTSNSIDKAKLQSCLSDFSSFVLRRSLCGLTTRQYDRWLPAAVNAIQEDLVDDLREYWSSRGWPGDEWIVERMHYLPLYKSNKSLVKLILGRIEESYGHKERINLDDLTIEHIMPQTTTSEWERDLGSGWFEKHQKWLHTIGNLTLTGYNSEMQNKAFVTKRNLYLKQSNLKLNLYFDDLNCWNDETISERGKKLSEMVIKIWENPIGSKGFDFELDLDSGIEDIKSPTNTIRQFAINRIGKSLNLSLVELTTARFRDDQSDTEILCTVSRQYDNSGDSKGFWFGLNPSQIDDLKSVTNGYVAFTCATPEIIFLVPISVLTPLLKSMNVTMEEGEPNSVRHWHCFIEFRNKQYFLLLSKEKTQLSLDQFSV